MFAGYWPTPAADNELVGPRINVLPKYAFSHSPTHDLLQAQAVDIVRLAVLPVAAAR